MKIGFCAPLKPLSHPVPSGDQAIARDVVSYFESQGEEVISLNEFRTPRFFQRPTEILRALMSQGEALSTALATRPDVFFTYHSYYKAPDITGPWLSRILGRPYVLLEAMYSEKHRDLKGFRAGYWLNRFALTQADHIFTNKTDDIGGLLKIVPRERVTYLPPAVDTQRFAPSPERAMEFRRRHGIPFDLPVISCAAMLRADRKSEGVAFLIESLGRLKERGLDFLFVHAGHGEKFETIYQLAQERLGTRAILLGSVSRDEVAKMMAASQFFAFPGIDEGFGLVYLEAQACGLPVVAFDNGGIPDAVRQNETGFLTPLRDPEAYDVALARLLTDVALCNKMGAAAREHVLKNHSREKNYQQILEKLRDLARSAL